MRQGSRLHARKVTWRDYACHVGASFRVLVGITDAGAGPRRCSAQAAYMEGSLLLYTTGSWAQVLPAQALLRAPVGFWFTKPESCQGCQRSLAAGMPAKQGRQPRQRMTWSCRLPPGRPADARTLAGRRRTGQPEPVGGGRRLWSQMAPGLFLCMLLMFSAVPAVAAHQGPPRWRKGHAPCRGRSSSATKVQL